MVKLSRKDKEFIFVVGYCDRLHRLKLIHSNILLTKKSRPIYEQLKKENFKVSQKGFKEIMDFLTTKQEKKE